ncbi:MAG: hypothetical protein GXP49_04005 [Deltaproteobacteria bacterium]|nr:hypothetical protein [Deltaproteobacteria bacterium]
MMLNQLIKSSKMSLAAMFLLIVAPLGCGGQEPDDNRSWALTGLDQVAGSSGNTAMQAFLSNKSFSGTIQRESDFTMPDKVEIGNIRAVKGMYTGCAASSSDLSQCKEGFTIDSTRGIYLLAGYKGLDIGEAHQQKIELYSPDNNLYSVYELDFTVQADPELTVSLLRVRGTAIQTYHMNGTWNALVFLDGQEAGTFEFDLN